MHNHSLASGPADGHVHRLPAGVKLGAAIALIILLVTARPSAPLYCIVGALLVLAAAVARAPAGFIVKRMLVLEPFVIGVAILALLGPNGMWHMLVVVARTTLCLMAIVLLSATTSFTELLAVLRRLRVPGLMVTTLALMHRYMHLLQEETARMRCARASRTFSRGRWWTWRGLATIIAQLFIRCGDRSERIYAAMCARGWK